MHIVCYWDVYLNLLQAVSHGMEFLNDDLATLPSHECGIKAAVDLLIEFEFKKNDLGVTADLFVSFVKIAL